MIVPLLRRGLTLLIVLAALLTGGQYGGVPDRLPALLILLAGIPHGAADHLLFARRFGRGEINHSLIGFGLFYAFIMLGYGLLWWVWPTAALILFLGISIFHFGQTHFHETRRTRLGPN